MATTTIERSVERSAPDLQTLFPGKYLSLTSFKRDGTAVATPVWFVSDGRRLFALTGLHTGKVKRIRRHPEVLVAPCGPSGKLHRPPVPARVDVLTALSDLDRVQQLLRERYRISYPLVSLLYRLGRRLRGDTALPEGAALAITVDA